MNLFRERLDGSQTITTGVVRRKEYFKHGKIIMIDGIVWKVNNSLWRMFEGKSPQLIELNVPNFDLFELEKGIESMTPEEFHRNILKRLGYRDEIIEKEIERYIQNCTYEFAEAYHLEKQSKK